MLAMKTNIGIVKSIVSEKLVNTFIKTGNLNEAKYLSTLFFNTLGDSPYLQLEYKIFNNIENKHITNDVLATRYIDRNIGLASTFSAQKITEEYKKLEKFVSGKIHEGKLEDVNLLEKSKLYESISTLIIENKKQYPDVDLLHESFEHVLNYLKTNKIEEINEEDNILIPENVDGDEVIELALTKFNEKYTSLNEDELKLIKKLATLNQEEKKEYLEEWKNDVIGLLDVSDKNGIEDKINESIDKVKKITYDNKTFVDKVSKLYEFKKSLT